MSSQDSGIAMTDGVRELAKRKPGLTFILMIARKKKEGRDISPLEI